MTGAWTAAGIAALLSAGAGYENEKSVSRKQDNALASQLRQQQQLQNQANQQTNQLIQKTANSTPNAAKASVLSQFQQALQANQGNADRPLAQAGNVSDAYTKAANNAALGISNYGNTNAGLLSSIEAPALQRQQESADVLGYNTALGGLKQQSAADQSIGNIMLNSIRPNPWLTAVASAAGSYAKAKGASIGANNGDGEISDLSTSWPGSTTDNYNGYSGSPLAISWPGSSKNNW